MYIIDDQRIFDMVLARLRIEVGVEPPSVGVPFVRDTEFPCNVFEPGTPGKGDCYADGHDMCYECKHLSYNSPMIQNYDELIEQFKEQA